MKPTLIMTGVALGVGAVTLLAENPVTAPATAPVPVPNAAPEKPEVKWTQAEVDAKIAKIRKWYAEIESDSSLKKVEIKPVKFSESRSKLTRYTSPDGEVKKLEVEWGGDHSFSQETYYFHEGSLIFIYAVDEYWKFTGTGKEADTETIDIGSQQRYYFEKGRCIRALEKQAESKDPEKLRPLLAKAKNKQVSVRRAAYDYQKRATEARDIKTSADIDAFIQRRYR